MVFGKIIDNPASLWRFGALNCAFEAHCGSEKGGQGFGKEGKKIPHNPKPLLIKLIW
jgi:hypothetical protein